MKTEEFFEQILSGELKELDIYNHAQSLTDDFQDDKLNLLWNEYWEYLNRNKSFRTQISSLDDFMPEDPFEYRFKQLGKLLSEKRDNTSAIYDQLSKEDTESAKWLNSIQKRDTYKFFEKINNGEISESKQWNYIENQTDYKLQKLKALRHDLDEYLLIKKAPFLQNIDDQQKKDVIDKYNDKGWELPIIEQIYDPKLDKWRDRKGDEKFDTDSKKYKEEILPELLDLEAIFFPDKFNNINHFELKLLQKIEEVENKTEIESVSSKTQHKSNNTIQQENNSISFSVLDKIVYLTGYWYHGNESAIDELLRNSTDFIEITEKFEKELKRNIVLAQSDSSLKRLFKHYLLEMNDLYRSENKIQDLKSYGNSPNSHKGKYRNYRFKRSRDDEYTEADEFQNYILAKDEFLSIIFESLRNNIHRTGLSISYFEKELKNSFLFLDGELIREFNIAKDIEGIYKTDETLNQNHINWLKSDDSLEQFIEALIKQKLIEERESEDIIKDHFEPVREQIIEPEPIEWLNTQALLAYMIDELNENHIQTNNIWKDTAPHFSVNGQTPKNLRQSAKGYRDNETGRNGGLIGKPKNHQLIDNILQNLPE
ncbi:hypothetical protein ACG2F4_13240 [Halalkalibaculum sp. DA3122]|uniref:hypothetical protein n=1 Tax=Halalkalibaculum sp. DA3122 TaxID=3373607 RepID=UPI00375535FB